MIIAYDTPGQLGNQLWAYSNLIAIAKDCNKSIVIILQNNYFKFLDERTLQKAKEFNVYILNSSTFKGRIFTKISTCLIKNWNSKWTKVLPIYLESKGNDKEYKNLMLKKRCFHFVNAWEHRINNVSFIKQRIFIRSIIEPEYTSKNLAQERINLLRKNFEIIVAVHIRRGDYKTFLDGKYYFDDKVYLDKMKQIANILKPFNVVFAIFSNEKIELNNYPNVNVSFSNLNSPIGDLWGISMCDYIIGPLSTFSMWASFWKNVPLLFIDNNTFISSMNDFSPVIAQDIQEKNYSPVGKQKI